jgi:hypothetical protein
MLRAFVVDSLDAGTEAGVTEVLDANPSAEICVICGF